MKAYRVISEFLFRGQRISPPGEFTPPTQEIADRLVAAKCLRERAAAFAAPPVAPPTVEASKPVEAPASVQEVVAAVGTHPYKKPTDSAKGRFGGGSRSRSR